MLFSQWIRSYHTQYDHKTAQNVSSDRSRFRRQRLRWNWRRSRWKTIQGRFRIIKKRFRDSKYLQENDETEDSQENEDSEEDSKDSQDLKIQNKTIQNDSEDYSKYHDQKKIQIMMIWEI